ncbi:MAG: hypothetical protein O7D86_07265 [Proteobacteria bacterium]|nr:hypothetical protein [Pseudomonadota bacterium]
MTNIDENQAKSVKDGLGFREFVPDDYLDDSIEIDEGMPVGSPVHFVLEVTGSTAGAVSFEFRFL